MCAFFTLKVFTPIGVRNSEKNKKNGVKNAWRKIRWHLEKIPNGL